MKKYRIKERLLVATAFLFIFLIIAEPEICTRGAARGLLLCGRVIIPALFPFTACVLFILKTGALANTDFAAPLTKGIFRITPESFLVMLLSLIGGYPVGARLLDESVRLKRLSADDAGVMLCYCVNAGPAFVILAVGSGIVGSKAAGYALLLSHLLPAFITAALCRFLMSGKAAATLPETKRLSGVDNFVLSVSESASSVLSICGYVLFFSTVNSYISHFAVSFSFLNKISLLLEVTNAVTLTKSVPLIAFLLGFGGLCVWCQVLSLSRHIKIKFPLFLAARIFHGVLSAAFSLVFFRIFGIAVPVFSNKVSFSGSAFTDGVALSLALASMVIVLLITIFTKKRTGKILGDLL